MATTWWTGKGEPMPKFDDVRDESIAIERLDPGDAEGYPVALGTFPAGNVSEGWIRDHFGPGSYRIELFPAGSDPCRGNYQADLRLRIAYTPPDGTPPPDDDPAKLTPPEGSVECNTLPDMLRSKTRLRAWQCGICNCLRWAPIQEKHWGRRCPEDHCFGSLIRSPEHDGDFGPGTPPPKHRGDYYAKYRPGSPERIAAGVDKLGEFVNVAGEPLHQVRGRAMPCDSCNYYEQRAASIFCQILNRELPIGSVCQAAAGDDLVDGGTNGRNDRKSGGSDPAGYPGTGNGLVDDPQQMNEQRPLSVDPDGEE